MTLDIWAVSLVQGKFSMVDGLQHYGGGQLRGRAVEVEQQVALALVGVEVGVVGDVRRTGHRVGHPVFVPTDVFYVMDPIGYF